jgi:hypothetical protein
MRVRLMSRVKISQNINSSKAKQQHVEIIKLIYHAKQLVDTYVRSFNYKAIYTYITLL